MPLIAEGTPAAIRRAHERQRATTAERTTLAKAIICGIAGVIVLGLLLWQQVSVLSGNVADLRGEIVQNRVIGCQRTVDEHLPLPAACRVAEVRRHLSGAP